MSARNAIRVIAESIERILVRQRIGRGNVLVKLNQIQLFAREKLGSTGLGQGVAIPHGRIKGLKDALGAFIRLAEPVPFDAPDGRPVSLLFVLLVPAYMAVHYLFTLQVDLFPAWEIALAMVSTSFIFRHVDPDRPARMVIRTALTDWRATRGSTGESRIPRLVAVLLAGVGLVLWVLPTFVLGGLPGPPDWAPRR